MSTKASTVTIPDKAPTLLQVIASVTWAFFGVQNSRNRRRDFTHGNPWQFMVVGFAMTGVVVLIFVVVVKFALRMAGT